MRTYTWRLDGVMHSGTLEDYARDYERAHRFGSRIGQLLWDDDGDQAADLVTVVWHEPQDDHIPFTALVGAEEANGQLATRA